MKKTKKFDYAKYGQKLMKDVNDWNFVKSYQFWHDFTGWANYKQYVKSYQFWHDFTGWANYKQYDDVKRNAHQWRRIYYTAKRQQRAKQRFKNAAEHLSEMAGEPGDKPINTELSTLVNESKKSDKPQVEYNYVDTADQLSELTQKVDACLSKLEELADIVNIKCRNRIVL
jgi:hypothetical protein